ncbi:MAG TPA: hypothetical protein VFU12_05670 [Glycomyces sp.]|nr:hypothetical protein [Glycomyces sp.]
MSPLDLLPFTVVTASAAASAALLLAGATKPGIVVSALTAAALSGQLALVAHRTASRFRSLAKAIGERGDESLGPTEVERIEFLQRRILAAFESERLETAERFERLRERN